MPTFNGELYLAAALRSLCTQQGRPDEVLIVDDGSEDETIGIAERFASHLPVRILRPSPKGSWMAMTNLGLQEASFEWVTILHQDDVWMPTRLQDLRGYLDGPYSVLFMDTRFIDDAGRPLGSWRLPRSICDGRLMAAPHAAASLFVQNWVAVPSTTFRAEAALRAGGLDEDLWYTADWDMWLKLAETGPVGCIPRFGSAFRVHRGSQTISRSRRIGDFRDQMLVVQRRHDWAPLRHDRPDLIRRAGALSTETNVVLAGFLHDDLQRFEPWLKSFRDARAAGVATYLRNSSIASRLLARAVLQSGGRLRPPTAPAS